jgi:hypothetical protein
MFARSTRRIPYFCNFNFNRTPRRIRNHPIASIAVHSDVRKEALGNPLSLSSLSLSLSLSLKQMIFSFFPKRYPRFTRIVPRAVKFMRRRFDNSLSLYSRRLRTCGFHGCPWLTSRACRVVCEFPIERLRCAIRCFTSAVVPLRQVRGVN